MLKYRRHRAIKTAKQEEVEEKDCGKVQVREKLSSAVAQFSNLVNGSFVCVCIRGECAKEMPCRGVRRVVLSD